jgi:hypothetical protein
MTEDRWALRRQVNVTYPADTYEDLFFPSLSLPGEMQQGVPVTMEFAVPATKVSEGCTRARLVAAGLENEVQVGRRNTGVHLYEPVTCPDGSLRDSLTIVVGIPDDSFFARVLWSRACGENSTLDMGPGWISRGYVWANASSLDSLEFQHVSAWRCNYTWSEIPTTVTLTSADGTNFQISPDMSPMPDTSRARPWAVEHQPLPIRWPEPGSPLLDPVPAADGADRADFSRRSRPLGQGRVCARDGEP